MTLLLFIIILGVIILIHEGGHFFFAKKLGVHVYEFAIGMGPKIWSRKSKKDETVYSIRLIPIGGFVSLAGEEAEDDKSVPKHKKLQAKKPWQRFLIMFFGPGFNFLSAILLLFAIGLIWGAPNMDPILSEVTEGSRAYQAGLREEDRILEVNGHSISTIDDISLYITIDSHKKATEFKVEQKDGDIEIIRVTPEKIEKDDVITYRYGINLSGEKEYGIFPALEYMVRKTGSLFKQMFKTVEYLFTGTIRINQLSGPVGIYSIVGEQSKGGIANILYLIAFLSINVGFINLLPIPAFDGGHILFIIIEKIKGSPVKPETENMIHTIGLFLLLALMLYITFQDIVRLF